MLRKEVSKAKRSFLGLQSPDFAVVGVLDGWWSVRSEVWRTITVEIGMSSSADIDRRQQNPQAIIHF
jgi:hypothetical protein